MSELQKLGFVEEKELEMLFRHDNCKCLRLDIE
jgi:hypothetical protein